MAAASKSGTRLDLEAFTIPHLVMYAYNVKNDQISWSFGSSVFADKYYDVRAKAADGSTPTDGQFRQMLQVLLAERCKLAIHKEPREMPVYALRVGSSGPKFKESAPDAGKSWHLDVVGRNYEVTMVKASAEQIIQAISSSFLDRPVIDKTGLTGEYDLRLVYTPQTKTNQTQPEPEDITIFTAVQRLGLKLEPQKARVEIIVVDHAEKPTEN